MNITYPCRTKIDKYRSALLDKRYERACALFADEVSDRDMIWLQRKPRRLSLWLFLVHWSRIGRNSCTRSDIFYFHPKQPYFIIYPHHFDDEIWKIKINSSIIKLMVGVGCSEIKWKTRFSLPIGKEEGFANKLLEIAGVYET